MFYDAKIDLGNKNTLNLDYNEFRRIVSQHYTKKDVGNTTYYLNELSQVVAREEDNVLNLYFNHMDHEIGNTPISMSIIKDFTLKMGIFIHKKADVIILGYLGDECNMLTHSERKKTVRSKDDNLVTIDPNEEIERINYSHYKNIVKELMLMCLREKKEQLKQGKIMQIGSISTIECIGSYMKNYTIPGYNIKLSNELFFGNPFGSF